MNMAPVKSDVYYSPTILGKRRFYVSDMDMDTVFEERQSNNSGLFKGYFMDLFKQSRSDSEGHSWDNDVIDKGKKKITALFQDYVLRTNYIYGVEGQLVRKLKWLCHTFNRIYDVCNAIPPITETGIVGDGVMPVSYDYYPFRDTLCYSMCKAVLNDEGFLENGSFPEPSLSILYFNNRWDELFNFGRKDFDVLYHDLVGKAYGLTDERRALVFPDENRNQAKQFLKNEMMLFSDDPSELIHLISEDEYVYYDFGVKPYYDHYFHRVAKVSVGKLDDLGKSKLLIRWCVSTLLLAIEVYDEYENSQRPLIVEPKNRPFHEETIGAMIVIFKFCLSTLVDIMSVLLSNYDQLRSMSEAGQDDGKAHYIFLIDREKIGKIYDLMVSSLKRLKNSEEFKSWDREDFINRVYSGDLKPYWVDGVSTSVMKFNIRRLSKYTDEQWLNTVSESLGVKPEVARAQRGYDIPNDYEKAFNNIFKE